MHGSRDPLVWTGLAIALIGIGLDLMGIQIFNLGLIITVVGIGILIWRGWPWLTGRLDRGFCWLARVLLRENASDFLCIEIQPHWGTVGNKRSLDFWIDVFNGSLGELQLQEEVSGILGFSTSDLRAASLPTAPILEVTEPRAMRGNIARLRIRQPLEQNEAESIEQSLSDGQAVTFYFSDVTVNFKAGKKHHRLPLQGSISFRESLRVIGWGNSSYSPLKDARGN